MLNLLFLSSGMEIARARADLRGLQPKRQFVHVNCILVHSLAPLSRCDSQSLPSCRHALGSPPALQSKRIEGSHNRCIC